MRRNYGGFVGLWAVLAVGCSSSSEVAKSGSESEGSAPPIATPATQTSTQSLDTGSVAPKVAKLLSRMEAIGEGSSAALDLELKEFKETPGALESLTETYAKAPSTATAMKWKLVHAVGQFATPASAKFLADVATSGPEIVAVEAKGEGARTDRTLRARYTAAVSLVGHLVAGVKDSGTAINRVLQDADEETARNLGVELFSAGKLSTEWRDALRSRHIFADFKRIEGAELDKLRAIDPATRPAGSPVNSKRQWTSVPPLSAAE